MPTIDGRKKQISMANEIVNPHTEKHIANEGLPYPKQPNKRGDIKVKFDIKFPTSLSQSQREALNQNLPR